MSLRQKFWIVSAALGLGVVLSFALGEIWLRMRSPLRLQNDRIVLPRNQVYRYRNTGLRGCDPIIIHHKNSLGFRGAEPPQDFKKALTIVAVGGSTTECFYLSDGHSWPEILGQQLAPDFPNVWLNNAGLDGHSTFGHSILLKDYLVQLHPKVALFLVGINDVGRNDLVISDRDFLKQNRDTTPLKRLARTLEEKSRIMGWAQNLLRAYAAWKRGLGHHPADLKQLPRLDVSAAQSQRVLDQHQTQYLPSYQARLENLVRDCRQTGIEPVLITQPALYGTGQDDVTAIDLAAIQVDAERNGRLAWAVLELYNDKTREVARTNRVYLIDLARSLPKSSQYFYDFYHFTNAGAAQAARIVTQGLRPFLRSKFSGS